MNLCKKLGEVLLGLAHVINKILKVEVFNGINLVRNAKMSVYKLHKIRKELTTERFEKYYNNINL